MKYLIVLLVLLLFILPINLVRAQETDVVDISEFPQALATALGLPLFAGQLLACAIILCLFLFPTMLLTHKKTQQELPIVIVGVMAIAVLVAFTWLPYWILLILCLIVALMYATRMKKVLGS